MKSTITYSLAGLGLAAILAIGLAGCSSDADRFGHMSKDQQVNTINYAINHPTPKQAEMRAKMLGSIGATQAANMAKGGQATPPAMPAGAPTH